MAGVRSDKVITIAFPGAAHELKIIFEIELGFYAGPGLLSGRIVIRIANARGQTVAYAGRALDGRLPKYKLPAGFRIATVGRTGVLAREIYL